MWAGKSVINSKVQSEKLELESIVLTKGIKDPEEDKYVAIPVE